MDTSALIDERDNARNKPHAILHSISLAWDPKRVLLDNKPTVPHRPRIDACEFQRTDDGRTFSSHYDWMPEYFKFRGYPNTVKLYEKLSERVILSLKWQIDWISYFKNSDVPAENINNFRTWLFDDPVMVILPHLSIGLHVVNALPNAGNAWFTYQLEAKLHLPDTDHYLKFIQTNATGVNRVMRKLQFSCRFDEVIPRIVGNEDGKLTLVE
jgi:hypothetical protein